MLRTADAVLRAPARPGLAVVVLGALAACDSTKTLTVVTVEARPSVHDVDSLEITFGNASATLEQTFDVAGRDFPVTFSVETPGRTGELTISVVGLDADAQLAALGAASTEIVLDQTAEATLLLEPADFPVNTVVAGQQRLSWARTSAGTQLAAAPDGTFTIGFTDDCGDLGRCDVWGRRFDVDAVPVPTAIAASDVQFNINRTDVLGWDPSLAVSPDGTMLAAWTTFTEVLAVAVTPEGDAEGVETIVSTGDGPGDPQVAAFPGGGFLVAWTETDPVSTNDVIRARSLTAAGAPATIPQTGNDLPFTVNTDTLGLPETVAVATTGDGLAAAFAWRLDNAIHVRFLNSGGFLVPAQELEIANYPVADEVWGPQIVASPDGRFLVAWGHRTSGGGARDDGAIIVRKIAAPIATQVGFEAVIARGLPEFPDDEVRIALAVDPDGPVLVSWQGCGSFGDGNGCGVHGQLIRDTGLRVGAPFVVNTTLANDQSTPSIAALGDGAFAATWTDDSRVAPDTSETGIRARVVYPDFAPTAGVIGAACGGAGEAVCDDGLVCMAGSDGEPHCHLACDPGATVPCPDGGSCTTSGSQSACIF